MSITLVMLDANILISAYDQDAVRTPEQRAHARDLIKNLTYDADVRFVTTSLIRYEVLCNIKNEEIYNNLKSIVDSYKLFEFSILESDSAITLFRANVDRVKELKNNEEPRKYKFDFLHIATARVHDIQFHSSDKKVRTLIQYLESETTKNTK